MQAQLNKINVQGLSLVLVMVIATVFLSILVLVVAIFIFRSEQHFERLNNEIQLLKQQKIETALRISDGDKSGVVGSQKSDTLQFIGATFGPVEGNPGLTKIQLDWKDVAHVNELRISDDKGTTLLAISAESSTNFVPRPYVVGSVPDGFTVREGNTFEELEAGKIYGAQLKGELDGESFDVSFNFNVSEIPQL